MNHFAVPNSEKCPVKAYKVYAENRHVVMKTNNAPFYSAVTNLKPGSDTLMKTMAQKAGLRPT